MTGIDTAPHAPREIKYTEIITKDIDLVQAELIFRGMSFEDKTKIIE